LFASGTYFLSNTVATTQINSNSQKLAQVSFSSPVFNLSPNGLAYWWFNNVIAGNQVSIYLESSTIYSWTSSVSYSNGTIVNVSLTSGSHNLSFTASKNDNYLLAIRAYNTLDYSINSSIQPVFATPYSVSKNASSNDLDYWWFNDVKAGSTLIVGVENGFIGSWNSILYFSNGTIAYPLSGSGSHSHVYWVPKDDNYLLELQPHNNYTIVSSIQPDPAFGLQQVTGWYWTGNTQVNSVASGGC
jgi:hypothetical protein